MLALVSKSEEAGSNAVGVFTAPTVSVIAVPAVGVATAPAVGVARAPAAGVAIARTVRSPAGRRNLENIEKKR